MLQRQWFFKRDITTLHLWTRQPITQNYYKIKFSIKTTARIGGILYLIIIFTGIFGEMFVRGKLIVAGNATATANNIIASQL